MGRVKRVFYSLQIDWVGIEPDPPFNTQIKTTKMNKQIKALLFAILFNVKVQVYSM